MKKLLLLALLAIATVTVFAQTKKVSILGDSYSTFKDYNPEGYNPFYPDANNDVKEVEQTWWDLYIKAKGYQHHNLQHRILPKGWFVIFIHKPRGYARRA